MPSHIIKADKLKKSKIPYIVKNGLSYSFDAKQGPNSGIEQLFKDFERDVQVGGKKAKDFDRKKNFETFLVEEAKFSKEQVKQIKQHYSQGPMLFVGGIPYGQAANLIETSKLLIEQPSDRTVNLSVESGEVYLKMSIERYPVKDINKGETIGYIEGPLEVLFKLDPKKGFVFQTLKTESDFLRDIYLGIPVTKERLLREAVNGKFINLLNQFNKIEESKKAKFQASSEIQLFLKTVNEHRARLLSDSSLHSSAFVPLLALMNSVMKFPQDSPMYQAIFEVLEDKIQEFNLFPDNAEKINKDINKILDTLKDFDQQKEKLDELKEEENPLYARSNEFFERQQEAAVELIKKGKFEKLSDLPSLQQVLKIMKGQDDLAAVISKLLEGTAIKDLAKKYSASQRDFADKLIASGDRDQLDNYIYFLSQSDFLIQAINNVKREPDNLEYVFSLCKKVVTANEQPEAYGEEFIKALNQLALESLPRVLEMLRKQQASAREASEGNSIRQAEQGWLGELIKKVQEMQRKLPLGLINSKEIEEIFKTIESVQKIFAELNSLNDLVNDLPPEIQAMSRAYLENQLREVAQVLKGKEENTPNADQRVKQCVDSLRQTKLLLEELSKLSKLKENPVIDLVYRAACEEAQKLLKTPSLDPKNEKKKILKEAVSNAREVARGDVNKLGALNKSIQSIRQVGFGKRLLGSLMILGGVVMMGLGWLYLRNPKVVPSYGSDLFMAGCRTVYTGTKIYPRKPDLAYSLGELHAEVTKNEQEKKAKAEAKIKAKDKKGPEVGVSPPATTPLSLSTKRK